MARFVGLHVSPKLTSICVVDETGQRMWRGQCPTDPAQLERIVMMLVSARNRANDAMAGGRRNDQDRIEALRSGNRPSMMVA